MARKEERDEDGWAGRQYQGSSCMVHNSHQTPPSHACNSDYTTLLQSCAELTQWDAQTVFHHA
jgi:hypothetical protein